VVSTPESVIPVLVVPTNEEAAIARQTAALVGVM
jgi:acetate kinase